MKNSHGGHDDTISKRQKSVWRPRNPRHIITYITEEGNVEVLSPKKTFWWMYYICSPNRGDSYFENKFRS